MTCKRRHPPRRRLFVVPPSLTRCRARERRASTADSSTADSTSRSIAIGPLFVEPASQQSEHRHPPGRRRIIAPASDEQAPPQSRRRAGKGTAIRLAADSSSTQQASTAIRLTADSSLSQQASRAMTASGHRRRAAAAATVAAKILKNIFGDVYVCRCASLVTVKKFKIWDKLIRNYKGS